MYYIVRYIKKKLEEEKRVKYVLTYLHITLNYVLDSTLHNYTLTSTTKTLKLDRLNSICQATKNATGDGPHPLKILQR